MKNEGFSISSQDSLSLLRFLYLSLWLSEEEEKMEGIREKGSGGAVNSHGDKMHVCHVAMCMAAMWQHVEADGDGWEAT